MALLIETAEQFATRGSGNIAVLGAPGAQLAPGSPDTYDLRLLTVGGKERASVAAGIIALANWEGKLLIHAGHGAAYKSGGSKPTDYRATEACAYAGEVNGALWREHGGLDLLQTGWQIIPGKPTDGSFDPDRFSGSTLHEASLFNQTWEEELEGRGVLGVVGGRRQLNRIADGADAMQLPVAAHLIGIVAEGDREDPIIESIGSWVIRRAILRGAAELPSDEAPEVVLAREQAFREADPLRKLGAVVFGPSFLTQPQIMAQEAA